LQEHKFDKAKPHFPEGARRPQQRTGGPRRHSSQHLQPASGALHHQPVQDVEEHFDYAVSLMNVGDYVTAREHIEKLLKQAPKTDFVIYGWPRSIVSPAMSKTRSSTSTKRFVECRLRYQARNDSDFHNLAEDPRFTELLYPDPGPTWLRRKAPSGKTNRIS
jgi:hypothetical protein